MPQGNIGMRLQALRFPVGGREGQTTITSLCRMSADPRLVERPAALFGR